MPAIDRWSRRYVATACFFLVVWQFVATPWINFSRQTWVVLGLYGFVFMVIFAKTYTLVPSYFSSGTESSIPPAVQYFLSSFGVLLMAFGHGISRRIGIWFWSLGIAVLVVTLTGTIWREAVSGKTGTSDVNDDRRDVDKASNLFIVITYLYLITATVSLNIAGITPATTHLFAAGTAALLIYSVGFRLLPRFNAVDSP
ncbi:MAG: hypothetical protein ABEJ72_02595, partial [Candidatus Aenigmatarchaeota archaeon]